MHIEELLDEAAPNPVEVTALAGERKKGYCPQRPVSRRAPSWLIATPGRSGWPASACRIRVPRIRHVTEREIPLRSYEALHGDRAVNDLLLRRVLYGISCRNYAAAAEAIPGAIGLSGSTVSRAFIEASAAKLRELQERDLSREDVVALVLDGKTVAESTMVVALGITMAGEKRFLGFVETDTENEQVVTPFLRSLVERGLDVSQGLLVIVDGGKGLRAAVRKALTWTPATAPWCNGVNGTSARTWSVTWPRVSSRCGGSVSSAPTTVRSTTRPSPPSSRSSMSWRIGTNRRPAVWRKASTKP